MEVSKERAGDVLHIRVTGRLDNHWSEPFQEAIEEMIREGAHHLRADLSGVNYLSSAGVGVLMTAYRDTRALNGSFIITDASERVRTILQLVALDTLLFGVPEEAAADETRSGPRRIETERALFECYSLPNGRASLRLAGDPARLTLGGWTAGDAESIPIRSDTFALGVGALGESFEECRGLFGEFVAASGTAAYMPGNRTTTPDYMTGSGELVPRVQSLYALVFEGTPEYLVRFEAATAGVGVPLSEIVATSANAAGSSEIGFVVAAEVSGLVSTMLRRSPAESGAVSFELPAVREWLSYLPEREYARNSCLIAGVASASPSEALRPFVRPLGGGMQGHVHAAVTAFRSLPRGKVALADVIEQAFQPRSVVSVVHLLRDERPIEGAGESELQRGACWVFPLGGKTRGGNA